MAELMTALGASLSSLAAVGFALATVRHPQGDITHYYLSGLTALSAIAAVALWILLGVLVGKPSNPRADDDWARHP